MELRSSCHLHFIQAVEGGLVTKILNVFHGRPALKFKKVNDIYEAGDTRNSDSLATIGPKVEFEELPIDCDRVEAESSCMLAEERTTTTSVTETLQPDCCTGDYAVKSELDDLTFGTMTLKQIKERCQAKKRKRSRSVGLSTETIETRSPRKQYHSILQSEEDEYGVMEPLSRWKSRILMDMKTKRKCIKSKVSTSSQHAHALSIVKSHKISSDQVIFQSSGNLPAFADIKVEFHEPSYSDSQNISVIAVHSSCASNEPVASSQVVSSEEPEAANDCVLENRISMVSIEEPETVKDCLLETGMPRISSEEPETANDCGFEAQSSAFFSNESQCCVVNEESYEHAEHIDPIEPDAANDCVLENRISMVSVKEPETVKDCLLETGMPRISSEEPETNDYGFEAQTSSFFSNESQCCFVNEESYEHAEHIDPIEPDAADYCVLENRISVVSIKEPETVKDCLLETGMPRISSEEPETNDYGFEVQTSSFSSNESQCCFVNEESYEHAEHIDPIEPDAADDCVLENRISMVSIKEPETVKDCLLEIAMPRISSGGPETANDYGFEAQTSTFFNNDSQCCVVNEESYEHMELIDPESILDVRASGGDVRMADNAEIVSHQFSDLSSSELKKEDSVIDMHPNDGFSESLSPSTDYSSDVCDNCQRSPLIHEKLCEANSSSLVQLPDVTVGNRLKYMELSNSHGLCLSEDRVEDNAFHLEASVISSPVSDCSSFWDSNSCSTPDGCLVSVADGSPRAEEKQYPLSACADAGSNCSTVIDSHVDEPVTLAEAEAEDCHLSKMQHPPERLLSTRKAISPTSQKRLCKAMESTELDDEQYYKYTRKLCYSKQTDNKIGRLEKANQIQRVEVTLSPKKVIGKPKNDKNGFHNKGILKVPRSSRAVPCIATGCTSVQSCSESVISFSLQQMRDIELIATKLTKELKTMKDIVEGTLCTEVYPATSLKYGEDEVRIAIQNATRVEESARRWLSIMARDCNRFCKIMKLTEKSSAGSGNVAHKEKRKIVFADEAGGQLCDVKTFENDMAYFMESHSEKPGIID